MPFILVLTSVTIIIVVWLYLPYNRRKCSHPSPIASQEGTKDKTKSVIEQMKQVKCSLGINHKHGYRDSYAVPASLKRCRSNLDLAYFPCRSTDQTSDLLEITVNIETRSSIDGSSCTNDEDLLELKQRNYLSKNGGHYLESTLCTEETAHANGCLHDSCYNSVDSSKNSSELLEKNCSSTNKMRTSHSPEEADRPFDQVEFKLEVEQAKEFSELLKYLRDYGRSDPIIKHYLVSEGL